jgi:HSP20 family protein
MAIIRIDPWRIQRQLLQPVMEDNDWPELTVTEGLNIYEENGNVVVEASVPGIPQEKIDITYEDGVLHISGKVEENEEEKNKNKIIHRMQRVSSFDYTTYLPRPIKEDTIEATVKNGVLTVKAPIAEEAKPRKITVKTK